MKRNTTAPTAPATVEFTFKNETPGAVRFSEEDSKGNPLEKMDDGAIGTLYVRKAFLLRQGIKEIPEGCTITIAFK